MIRIYSSQATSFLNVTQVTKIVSRVIDSSHAITATAGRNERI